jgi:hypothetical protein
MCQRFFILAIVRRLKINIRRISGFSGWIIGNGRMGVNADADPAVADQNESCHGRSFLIAFRPRKE